MVDLDTTRIAAFAARAPESTTARDIASMAMCIRTRPR